MYLFALYFAYSCVADNNSVIIIFCTTITLYEMITIPNLNQYGGT